MVRDELDYVSQTPISPLLSRERREGASPTLSSVRNARVSYGSKCEGQTSCCRMPRVGGSSTGRIIFDTIEQCVRGENDKAVTCYIVMYCMQSVLVW